MVRTPDHRPIRGLLAQYCNNFAWGQVGVPGPTRDPKHSLVHRTVDLAPAQGVYLKTLGVAQYLAGQRAGSDRYIAIAT